MKSQQHCRCKGRGFFLDSEVIDGFRSIIICDHEPDEKYKRMYETVKRIQENEPEEE